MVIRVGSPPEIVTKYCSPAAHAAMMQGNFWIGTLAYYASGEGGAGGLMDDLEEGKISVVLRGEVRGADISLPNGNRVFGMTALGCETALAYRVGIDRNVFCVAAGPYDADTHRFIRDGDFATGYAPNSEYTEYIEFDTVKLFNALQEAARQKYHDPKLSATKVVYGTREVERTAAQFKAGITSEQIGPLLERVQFLKPNKFTREREFRYCIEMPYPIAKIDTKGMPEYVKELLRQSIIDHSLSVPSTSA